ncbi:MAG: type II toxin-antitoxin system Phd/YefM family antitoxin [Thermoleophilia bacterium]
MREVSVREARAEIARLLEAAEAGEDVIITRRGRPVARLVAVAAESVPQIAFTSRGELRRSLPASERPSSRLIREMREDRG